MRIPGVRLHSRTCLPELSAVANVCCETVTGIAALGFDAAVLIVFTPVVFIRCIVERKMLFKLHRCFQEFRLWL
jgi:hypothetical protein